jgi:hypothetical protein
LHAKIARRALRSPTREFLIASCAKVERKLFISAAKNLLCVATNNGIIGLYSTKDSVRGCNKKTRWG